LNLIISPFNLTFVPFLEGAHFEGILSSVDLAEIWECIGGDVKNIKQQCCSPIPGKCLEVTYSLKEPVKILSLTKKEEFNFERKGALRIDIFRARLVNFGKVHYTLGDQTTVTFQNTLLKIPIEVMTAWLEPFGEIKSEFK